MSASLYRDSRLWGVEKYSVCEPSDWKMRIPHETLDAVCFLGVNLTSGEHAGKFYALGTGFFIGVEHGGYPFTYLATARHVLDEAKRGGFNTLLARVNTMDGGATFVDLGPSNKWAMFTNEAIDVAVLPLPNLDTKIFSHRLISPKTFADSAAINSCGIGAGDELFTVGLFVLKSGKQRNMPIVRTGVISAMPLQDEPFTRKGGTYHAYLAEMRSIGGLSGSPVFVYLDQTRLVKAPFPEGREIAIFCLGLIRGHWDLKRELSDSVEIEDTQIGYSKGEDLNVGIAVVMPVHYITAIIDSEKLKDMRDQIVRKYDEENEPTEDSVQIPPPDLTRESFNDVLKRASRKVPESQSKDSDTSE
jgi:hypothetical protein